MSTTRNYGAGVFGVSFGGMICGRFNEPWLSPAPDRDPEPVEPLEVDGYVTRLALRRDAEAGRVAEIESVVLKAGTVELEALGRWWFGAGIGSATLEVMTPGGGIYQLWHARPTECDAFALRLLHARAGGAVSIEKMEIVHERIERLR